MTHPRFLKDTAALGLVLVAFLAYLAADHSWNVWLVGSSTRWATGVALVLGLVACGLGERENMQRMEGLSLLSMLLGVSALVLAVWAFVTASVTPLSLLVVCEILLWAIASARHVVAYEHTRHLHGAPS